MLHKPKCKKNKITTVRVSPESHLHWKDHFHKNPLYLWMYADFEADNEKDKSSVANKTTNIYKQNPVLDGYHIESELDYVLHSSYYKYPFGYNKVDWFVDEVIKLENVIDFYFKNTKKAITMTEKDEEDVKIINICRFCETNIECDKVRDNRHLTG